MHTNYTTPQATTRAETDFVSDLDTPCLLLVVSLSFLQNSCFVMCE